MLEMYEMALCYISGSGVSVNYEIGYAMMKKAANLGCAEAAYLIGELLDFPIPEGVQRDQKEAIKYYEIGANKNQPEALTALASCYQWADGVGKDIEKAKELYKRAAKMGNYLSTRKIANVI